jgi:hypothetical protein
VWEFIHRTSLIPAYVRRTSGGRLARSRLALDLDRSEKVALSYALGQAMAAIFCAQVLSVRFLMHIDRYAARFSVRFGSAQRADLFGQDALRQWIVAEAKGRSNSMERALMNVLVAQKRAIVSVGGVAPILALGCVASFPPTTRTLRVDAFDPEPGELEQVSIDVDVDRYILAYYEPFLTAIELSAPDLGTERSADEDQIEVARLDTVGIRIGLLRDVARLVRQARDGETSGLAESIGWVLERTRNPSVFPDGTLLDTDWDVAIETPDRDSDDLEELF